MSMLDGGTQYDILQGNLYGYKGAIFENLITDIFVEMGRQLYYYHKNSGLEIDFVTRYKGGCYLVEVKATTGNTKSAKTILAHSEKYHVSGVIKLGQYIIEKKEQDFYCPSIPCVFVDRVLKSFLFLNLGEKTSEIKFSKL